MAVQAELLLKSGQVVLDEIAKRRRTVYFVYRGVKVLLDRRDLYMRILWPPLELPPDIAKRVMTKLNPAYEKAKKLVEEAGIKSEIESRAKALYEAVSGTLGEIREHYKAMKKLRPSRQVTRFPLICLQ